MQNEPQTIWRLVQQCANSLTSAGQTPFTRGDLISCVRRRNPNCGPNSINPIIQGLTDNLKGGAPGAVGKNILHSVGRGLFVLTERGKHVVEESSASVMIQPKVRPQQASKNLTPNQQKPNSDWIDLEGNKFFKVCDIRPNLNETGQIQKYMPQDRYENLQNLPLNNYGVGPYCKFKIPRNLQTSGVYVITVDAQPKYVGECQNLSNRYNMGYGNISPRNCFVGGQETNCRINHLIFSEIAKGATVGLYFLATEDFKRIELSIRHSVKLDWNRA